MDSIDAIINEMEDYLAQEVEPDLDKIANWHKRLQAIQAAGS